MKRFIVILLCLIMAFSFGGCTEAAVETVNTVNSVFIKTYDVKRCAGSSIKFDMVAYSVTPNGFDIDALTKNGYYMTISVSYEVYYKKDWDVLWDIGYVGSPKYEASILNSYGFGTAKENLSTSIKSIKRTISYTSSAADLKDMKLVLTFSTDNIQNVIYFRNIFVTYQCNK